ITRNDTKNMELYFTDADPARAQAINKAATQWIEDAYRRFFSESSKDMYVSLQSKVAGMDSTLLRLDDSIASLRARYSIHNQLLPVRGKALQAAPASASAEQAAGIELLQELTSRKDQILTDRSNFQSLMNEYYIGLHNENINMFYRIQDADKPEEAS